MSSGRGGVGGMIFVTGSCGVSSTGVSFRTGLIGVNGSSPGRNLLGRLGDEDEENQARFLGTSFFSGCGRLASIVGVGGSEIGKLVEAVSGRSSTGSGDCIVVTVVEWEAG